MKRIAIALGAALCVLALAPSGTASHTLVVDDNGAECPGAMPTIQGAVLAADPGTTIYVCAGTYTGTVDISGPAKDGIRLIAKHPAEQVILDGSGTTTEGGFWLQNVSGVLIEGFTVRHFDENILLEGATDSIVRKNLTHSAHHDGLHLRNFSSGNLLEENESFDNKGPNGCGLSVLGGSTDNVVIKNEFYGNTFRGIQLVGAGAGNHLKDNLVSENGVTNVVFFTPWPGTGILNVNTPGTLIDDNLVEENAGHGILVTAAGSTSVMVKDNAVVHNGSGNDHDGIRLEDVALGSNTRVVNNRSERNRHDGVHLWNAHSTVVRDNVVFDNGTSDANNGCGIDIENGSSNNTIRNNDIEKHDRAGIRLRRFPTATAVPPTNNLVIENDLKENVGTVAGAGYGILLQDADFNTFIANDSKRNSNDGLRAAAMPIDPPSVGAANSEGNTFARNDMVDNATHDCHDDSAGPHNPPALVANMWIENDGKTENRDGLCKDAVVTPPATHP
jgi:parallel beta-helix repeat protein